MRMERLIKQAKGVIFFVGFIAFAISIVGEPMIDVQKQISARGWDVVVFAALFALSGMASLIYGVLNWNWNGLLFAPYFAFTGFALEAAHNNPELSSSTATVYLFLGVMLLVEYAVDNDLSTKLREWRNSGNG
jgi:hypothetical protein